MTKDELNKFLTVWTTAGSPGVLSLIKLPTGEFDLGLKKIIKFREMTAELQKACKAIYKQWPAGRYELIARVQDGQVDRIEIYTRVVDPNEEVY